MPDWVLTTAAVRECISQLRVVELSKTRGRVNCPADHWARAREQLLGDVQLPLLPLAGFFRRDFAFEDYNDPTSVSGLVEGFAEVFRYTDDMGDEELGGL